MLNVLYSMAKNSRYFKCCCIAIANPLLSPLFLFPFNMVSLIPPRLLEFMYVMYVSILLPPSGLLMVVLISHLLSVLLVVPLVLLAPHLTSKTSVAQVKDFCLMYAY